MWQVDIPAACAHRDLSAIVALGALLLLLLLLQPLTSVVAYPEILLLFAIACSHHLMQNTDVRKREWEQMSRVTSRMDDNQSTQVLCISQQQQLQHEEELHQEQDRVNGWKGKDEESVGSDSTSDASDMAFLTTSSMGYGEMDDDELKHMFLTSSICMSRYSSEQQRNVLFSHATGPVEMRRSTVVHLFRPWKHCTLQLSLLTGELFVHEPTKLKTTVMQISHFTGATIHSKRRNTFTVMIYGQPPLRFRTATIQDTELWVRTLEYAKECTWHLWS